MTNLSNLATSPRPQAPAQNSPTLVTGDPGDREEIAPAVARAAWANLVTGLVPGIPGQSVRPTAAWCWLVLALAAAPNQSPEQLWTVQSLSALARYPG